MSRLEINQRARSTATRRGAAVAGIIFGSTVNLASGLFHLAMLSVATAMETGFANRF